MSRCPEAKILYGFSIGENLSIALARLELECHEGVCSDPQFNRYSAIKKFCHKEELYLEVGNCIEYENYYICASNASMFYAERYAPVEIPQKLINPPEYQIKKLEKLAKLFNTKPSWLLVVYDG